MNAVACVAPYMIEFEIINESQRVRYPDGWIPVVTSESKNRQECYRLLRAQGYTVQQIESRRWRVVPNPARGPGEVPTVRHRCPAASATPSSLPSQETP